MGINRGKQFEYVVKELMKKQSGISIDRLPDPMGGYAGVRNICDFIVYQYPYQYYFECKTCYGNTLNFKSVISVNQWDGLWAKSKIPGVVAGVLVWFIDHNKTAFIPVQQLMKVKLQSKSLNIKDLSESAGVDYISVGGVRKRIFFDYDMKTFFQDLKCWAENYWRGDGSGKQ